MSTSRLVHAITLLAVFAMASRLSVDTDTWWHLRAGEWMVENQSVLRSDPFSYTRGGADWNYPGWLVEIPMFVVFNMFGAGGLNLWTAAMVTLAFAFVWATLSGGPFLRAFTIILAAAASGVYWAARPYLVTFVLSAVFLWILEDYRWRGKDRLWWLPFLMVVWANSHGGFAVGLILIAVYGFEVAARLGFGRWARGRGGGGRSQIHVEDSSERDQGGKRLRKLAIVGGFCLLAVAVNPSGPEMLLYPIKTVSIGGLQDYIAEWQSPNFHETRVLPFLGLLLLTFGAVGVSRRRVTLGEFLLVAGFASLGLLAARNIALFALAAPAVLTRHVSAALFDFHEEYSVRVDLSGTNAPGRTARVLNVAILALLLAAAGMKAASVYPARVNTEYFQETYPVGAVAYLKEEAPAGRLFNSYNWGGYLLWALPDYPVFIDGRTDLFDDEVIDAWIRAIRAEGDWELILSSWGINLVLLEPASPLVSELRAQDWRILHQDSMSILIERP